MAKLSVEELQGILAKFEQRVQELPKKLEANTAEYLGSAIEKKVTSNIADAIVGGSKRGSVDISIKPSNNGTDVTARSKDLIFMEFGAGVHFNGEVGYSNNPYAAEFPSFTIGSYGKGYGQYDTWTYRNESGETVTTHGVPSSMPVYRSVKQTKRHIGTLARETWKQEG